MISTPIWFKFQKQKWWWSCYGPSSENESKSAWWPFQKIEISECSRYISYINDDKIAWLSVEKEVVEKGYWKGCTPVDHNLALIRFLRKNEHVIQVFSDSIIDACLLKTRGSRLGRSPLKIRNLDMVAHSSPPLCTAEQLGKFEEFRTSR
jgi:hypothetical protein